jgi:hypothetical protein
MLRAGGERANVMQKFFLIGQLLARGMMDRRLVSVCLVYLICITFHRLFVHCANKRCRVYNYRQDFIFTTVWLYFSMHWESAASRKPPSDGGIVVMVDEM